MSHPHNPRSYPSPSPEAPKRKRHVVLWAILGAVLLIAFVSCLSSLGAKPQAPPAPATTSNAPAVVAPVVPQTVLPAAPAPVAPVAPAAPVGPLTTFGNGTYEVGTEVEAGKYRSPGVQDSIAPLCYWDLTDSSGSIKDQGVTPEGPSRATLTKGLLFKSSGCQDWTKTG